MNLSKSRYCRGVQCPKILWLDVHKPEERDDSALSQATLDTGKEVGNLAKGYFGKYIEVPFNGDKSVMIRETKKLLDAKTHVICEASFSCEGNFCSVDILRNVDGGVEIVEVKSAAELKPNYIDDIAYQYYVLTSCGLNIKKASLMYINSEYVRHGALDLRKLFTVEDCTEAAREKQAEVAANIARFQTIIEKEAEPDCNIGGHCGKPYECDYHKYCWRHIPPNSIFDISGRFDKKWELYHNGIITFEQVLKSDVKLNDKTRQQIECEVKNLPPMVDNSALKEFLHTLTYPLYFLDFETFQDAIPSFDGQRPYQKIPSQYSLHIQALPGAAAEHREFLAEEGTDPRRAVAERLCADIPQDVCVLAYNMGFEKSCIKKLAAQFPDLQTHLMNIHNNIKDLMKPFQDRVYYCKELRGSYSIKDVLPALCPSDPELDYNALDMIHNGGEAMNAFPALAQKSPEERERIRTALLAYCRLDTLAMVKILEKLQDAAAGV